MPRMNVGGMPHSVPAARVFVVIVGNDGSKQITEVIAASLTLDAEYPDVRWWDSESISHAPTIMHLTLEGVMGQGMAYSGDLPDEQRAIGTPRPAIERGA